MSSFKIEYYETASGWCSLFEFIGILGKEVNMDWKQHEERLLTNPKFREITQKLEPEYQLARSIILNKIKKGHLFAIK